MLMRPAQPKLRTLQRFGEHLEPHKGLRPKQLPQIVLTADELSQRVVLCEEIAQQRDSVEMIGKLSFTQRLLLCSSP